ncbi:hypothetical protein AMTRI_Chr12g270480 [Amborella trichopoda]
MEDCLWRFRTVRDSYNTQRALTRKLFRSNHFLGSEKDTGYVSDLARQSTLRGHGMSNFSIKMEFYELSLGLEDHFEIFQHIQGFNVTIVTSANTQDETLPPWSGFLQKDEVVIGKSQRREIYEITNIDCSRQNMN